jgi:threonine dehydratase
MYPLYINQAYLAGQRRVVAVSAGNAGLAAAHAATRLGMPVTVCVPAATSEVVLERLRREGAEVKVGRLLLFSNKRPNLNKTDT